MYICDNISRVGANLKFAGQDVCRLAEEYGTPLYLMDENKIREKCRIYLDSFRKHFPEGSLPLYASKAACFQHIYRIMADLGMGIDVVSSGEIYTALRAGFPAGNIFFHGNNKTPQDIVYALDWKIGYFVVDNMTELLLVQKEAEKRGVKQKILIRITPGIDPHTYAEVNTGMVDSKFGNAIETGQAEEIVTAALSCSNLELTGYHCHVGSQVFSEDVFERAAEVMLTFASDMRRKPGAECRMLDLGGGFGVPYAEGSASIDIEEKIAAVSERIRTVCRDLSMEIPRIFMEPGRSIVADAGMTVYTCGNVKKIPGYKNYVSVDGGMTDNPRYALYRSAYTCYAAGRMNEECTMKADIVGRCCESGDIIQPDVMVPGSMEAGDIVAVCTTGAYNYSMASNYNRIGRAPVVMLKDGFNYVAVKRESFEDMCRNEI